MTAFCNDIDPFGEWPGDVYDVHLGTRDHDVADGGIEKPEYALDHGKAFGVDQFAVVCVVQDVQQFGAGIRFGRDEGSQFVQEGSDGFAGVLTVFRVLGHGGLSKTPRYLKGYRIHDL